MGAHVARASAPEARILIIDDEPTNVALLDRILAMAGYRNVEGVTKPAAALERFEAFGPDIVLLDLHMPPPDGYELLRELRSRSTEIFLPILVLTADATAEARHRSLRAGASDFLTKPFDQVEVLLRIGNLLENRFLQLELREQNDALEAAVAERTTELRERLEDLRRVDEQRRGLLGSLVQAQEEERMRLAGDIHDDSIQAMTAVGMRLEILRRRLAGAEGGDMVEDLGRTVAEAIRRLRHLLFGLRPPALDQDGLAAALRDYASGTMEGGAVEVECRLAAEPEPQVRTILFRIAQEALTNVRKHASAEHVDVVLEERESGFFVRIRDDGVGFDPSRPDSGVAGHLGLPSMRERAESAGGWWRITSRPGEGTSVEAWVPGGRSGARDGQAEPSSNSRSPSGASSTTVTAL